MKREEPRQEREHELAERVRRAVIEAAVAGWEDAALAGLCGEGAFEAAVGRMRSLELEPLVGGGEPAAEPPAAIIGR
jgi:hypothetical protein